MEPVVAVFILDEKPNGQCTGQADSQAGNIDQRICFALKQISPGDFDIASEHGKWIRFLKYESRLLQMVT
jgi:hypothetical protein